jgi:hypothetical protein
MRGMIYRSGDILIKENPLLKIGRDVRLNSIACQASGSIKFYLTSPFTDIPSRSVSSPTMKRTMRTTYLYYVTFVCRYRYGWMAFDRLRTTSKRITFAHLHVWRNSEFANAFICVCAYVSIQICICACINCSANGGFVCLHEVISRGCPADGWLSTFFCSQDRTRVWRVFATKPMEEVSLKASLFQITSRLA